MNWSSLKIKDDHIAFPISLLIRIRPYLIAAAGVVVATLIEMVFPHVFERASLFLYWPIVILTGWIGGFFPGLFAAVLAILFSNYYILPPRFAFTGDGLDLTILLLFVVITGFMAWLRDRQRQADELLYQKQQEMEVTLASIGDGVIVTDAEQIITFINAVAQKLTGWSEAEAVGKPISEVFRIVNEDTRQPTDIPIQKAIEQGAVIGLANHTLLLSKTGEEWPISDSAAPIRSASGRIIGVVLVFRDDSKQRSAERSLRESEMRYRNLVENATDIIYTLDLQDRITSINPVAEEVTGYSRDELVGMPLSQLMAPSELQRMEEMFHRKLAGEEKTVYQLEILTKDQQRRILEINSQLVYHDNQLSGIEGIARDITARKAAEQRIVTLHNISAALAKAVTLEEVASVIIDQTLPSIGGHHGAVGLVTPDGQGLELIKLTNLSQQEFEQYQYAPLTTPGPMTDAVRTDKVVWIETQKQYVEQYPLYADVVLTRTKTQAGVALPLRIRERIIGCLMFSFPEIRKHTPEGQNFLETLADYCAQSIERALLNETEQETRRALQTRVHQQSIVAEIGQKALTSTELEPFMEATAFLLAQTLSVEFVKILELYPEENYLLLKAGVGWADGYVGSAREGTDDLSPAGYTLKAKVPVIVTDLRTETRFSDPPLLHEHNVISGMSVIIQGYNRPYGVLGVYTTQSRVFSQDDIYFLQSVANVIGAAIENDRLLQQAKATATVEERQRLARELHDSVTQAMFSATTLAEIVPRIWQRNPERAMEHLNGVIKLNRGAMAEMRTLLLELRPEVILNNSLKDLYQQLVNAVPARSEMEAELVVEGEIEPLPPDAHLALYRIVQESINNVLKHSQATRLRIELAASHEEVRVKIVDNGQGFDTSVTRAGLGLGSMRERAAGVGAVLEIDSQLGHGTTITLVYRTSSKVMRSGG